jgi:hypothetical protein
MRGDRGMFLFIFAIVIGLLQLNTVKNLFMSKEKAAAKVNNVVKEANEDGLDLSALISYTTFMGSIIIVFYAVFYIMSAIVLNNTILTYFIAAAIVYMFHNLGKARQVLRTGELSKPTVLGFIMPLACLGYTVYFIIERIGVLF